MLVHKVTGLLQAPIGTVHVLTIQEPSPAFGPDLSFLAPLHGSARVHRTQRGIFVQCNLETVVQRECSRCLEPLRHELRARFEEEFLLEAGPSGAPGEAEVFLIDEHHILDLTEAARQYLVMGLPMNPLCRPECPGLCPVCGAPLEGHSSPCGEIPESSPFRALASLLSDPP